MKLSELLLGKPPARTIPGARAEIRERLKASGKRVVVIDDDPTGSQTVHGVTVYLDWSVEELRRALASGEPMFFICTNSRGLDPASATKLSRLVGQNLREAADIERVDVILASRSDSTLRGHFPYEVEALAEGLDQDLDGILIVPAFFEAGRYTIDDVHWVEQGGEAVPAGETEFANDPTFGFKNSNLKLWIEEKTGGTVKADTVRSISLEMIRSGGPEAVEDELMQASDGIPIILNAICYDDLEVLSLGILCAESSGKRFAYRCAASFLKARGGFEDKPLLTHKELAADNAPGLVVVGSYVGKTSRQLDTLLSAGLAVGIELDVDKLLNEEEREHEIGRVSDLANETLRRASSAAVYTSRSTHLTGRGDFLAIGKTIMDSLCETVRRIETRPGFFISKGGITSIEIARAALGVREAFVLGQILPGVPVWRLGEDTRWPGIPYVVFPGNVGGDDALHNAVSVLRSKDV